MFDDVAKRYDVTNAVLSVGNSALWRMATVRAIGPKPGMRVLDVAAGTGTSAAAIARTGAEVVALDFSKGMVEQGRVRHPEIEFVVGDAEQLPFGDDEFDVVTISFGLRNVQHPQRALDEMFRVLKPGGRLVICEFSRPPLPILRAGYEAYLRWVMPAVAAVSSSNSRAYAYLAESIADWPDQATLSGWIRGAGFTRVAHRNLTAGVVALHRGHKPDDAGIRASVARRNASRTRGAKATAAAAASAAEAETSAVEPSADTVTGAANESS